MKYSNQQIEALLLGIENGSITEYQLPEDLYFAIAEYLKAALYQGYGGNLASFPEGSSALGLLEELRENIYMFSAAKTYQEVKTLTSFLTDENGALRSFKDFKEDALKTYEQYNVNWLETERSTAIGQAQNARKWNSIERDKDLFPLLRYSAVVDRNTSEICAPLDGVVLPVGHPFWSRHMPLNHFNCRCIVDQLREDEAEVTNALKVKLATGPANELMEPVFKSNAGKNGMVYSEKHPYFEVPDKDKAYAKRNFDLPIPETDKKHK